MGGPSGLATLAYIDCEIFITADFPEPDFSIAILHLRKHQIQFQSKIFWPSPQEYTQMP